MRRDEQWTVIILALAAGFMGGWLGSRTPGGVAAAKETGLKPAGVVEAQEFRLVDPAGRVESVWNSGRSGARLTFGPETGSPRVVIGLLDNGDPGVSLYDREGKNRADLRAASTGHPTLRLGDDKRGKSLLLGAHGIGLFNQQFRGRLIQTREGPLKLDVAELQTDRQASLAVAPGGKAALSVGDASGKIIWSAP